MTRRAGQGTRLGTLMPTHTHPSCTDQQPVTPGTPARVRTTPPSRSLPPTFSQLPKRGKPRINAPCYAKLPRDSSVTVARRNRARRRPRESQIRIGNLYAAYLCKTGDTLAPRAIPNGGDLSLPACHARAPL